MRRNQSVCSRSFASSSWTCSAACRLRSRSGWGSQPTSQPATTARSIRKRSVSSTPACRFFGSTWPGPPALHTSPAASLPGTPGWVHLWSLSRSPPAFPCNTPDRVHRWSLSRSPATSSPSPRAPRPSYTRGTPVARCFTGLSPWLPPTPHAGPGRAGPAISHFEDKYEVYIRWKLFEFFRLLTHYTPYIR